MSEKAILLIILIAFVIIGIIKIALLKLYMNTIKPKVDNEGNIITKPVKDDLTPEEREEREFDKDW